MTRRANLQLRVPCHTEKYDVWYTGWAIGTMCGCQRSCLVCLSCGCVLNSVHFIRGTFTFEYYSVVVMFCNSFDSFSHLFKCVPSPERSIGDVTSPHQCGLIVPSYGANEAGHKRMWSVVVPPSKPGWSGGWSRGGSGSNGGRYKGNCLWQKE